MLFQTGFSDQTSVKLDKNTGKKNKTGLSLLNKRYQAIPLASEQPDWSDLHFWPHQLSIIKTFGIPLAFGSFFFHPDSPGAFVPERVYLIFRERVYKSFPELMSCWESVHVELKTTSRITFIFTIFMSCWILWLVPNTNYWKILETYFFFSNVWTTIFLS